MKRAKTIRPSSSPRRLAKQALYPYKSHLEIRTQAIIPAAPYETEKIYYVKQHSYTPDFKLAENVYLECKGRFVAQDRAKHLLIKQQHPEIIVYFLFERPDLTLSKASKTTYAQWCEKHGYEWTTLSKGIPEHWLQPHKENE